jgi:hypothetical protein
MSLSQRLSAKTLEDKIADMLPDIRKKNTEKSIFLSTSSQISTQLLERDFAFTQREADISFRSNNIDQPRRSRDDKHDYINVENLSAVQMNEIYRQIRELLLNDVRLYLEKLKTLAEDLAKELKNDSKAFEVFYSTQVCDYWKSHFAKNKHRCPTNLVSAIQKSLSDFFTLRKLSDLPYIVLHEESELVTIEDIHKFHSFFSASHFDRKVSEVYQKYRAHLNYFTLITRHETVSYEEDCKILRDLHNRTYHNERHKKEDELLVQMFLFRATIMHQLPNIIDNNYEDCRTKAGSKPDKGDSSKPFEQFREPSQGYNDVVIVRLSPSSSAPREKFGLKCNLEAYRTDYDDSLKRERGIALLF